MAPKEMRGSSSGSNPKKDAKQQRGAKNPNETTRIETTFTRPSSDYQSESQVSAAPNPKWLTAPESELKAGEPTAPSCSQVAGNADWSMAVLHELGAYCVGLPPDDSWELNKLQWPDRERLNERFLRFRAATGTRRWDQIFQNTVSCGVTSPLEDLHANLCANAALNFKNGTDLDAAVRQYLLPRIAVVLRAVARAQRFLRMRGVDGLALNEADYRQIVDPFLDDLLNNEPEKRSAVIERRLNFPRNEIYDEVAAEQTHGTTLTASAIRKQEHVAFRRFLAQGVRFYGGVVSDAPATTTTIPNKYELGKQALAAIDAAFATDSEWQVVFFRELTSMRLKEEDVHVKEWGQVPMTLAGRLRLSPRTGKCDTVNFLHLKVTLPVAFTATAKIRADAIERLRECSLVHLTNADVKDDGESMPKDKNDLAAYRACSQLTRTVNLANVNDVIGHAALYADLADRAASKSQAAMTPAPKVLPTPTGLPAPTGLPLLLPVLLYEYKREHTSHSPSGLFQLRLYLNATCRFLEMLGVIDFMIFGILTEGTQVVVIGAWRDKGHFDDPAMTWIVDQYTAKYDISKPQDAFQFACFVVWVKVVHMPVLEGLLTEDKLKLFAEKVLAGQMNWTMYHQNPPKTKNTNTKTNTNTNTTPPAGGAQ